MTSKQLAPKGWPSEVEFISDMDWRQVHSEVAMGVRPTQNNPKRPSKVVRIKTIEDPKHPAYKQRGLFANQTIKPNTRIIDYVGVVRATCEESKTSDYIIQFTNQLSIDAERRGNEARFINDYRGTNGNVNVHFKTYPHHQGVRLGVFSASRKIKKGEELLVTYGRSFWKERGINHLHVEMQSSKTQSFKTKCVERKAEGKTKNRRNSNERRTTR
ncbi:hypothetical protein AAMO2058_000415400 [Amorphochlora amoebiformis]